MDDHCHCPPTMDHCDPPPCEPQDSSSWNIDTAHHHHCHPPPACPPSPPPYEQQQDFFWNPAFRPAFNPGPYPRWSSSSSLSNSDDGGVPCTVCVEAPPSATLSGDRAPLLESKVHVGAAGPSATEVLFVLLFWAIVAGFVYWYWF